MGGTRSGKEKDEVASARRQKETEMLPWTAPWVVTGGGGDVGRRIPARSVDDDSRIGQRKSRFWVLV
ncbi:hypothetical protein L2E82_11759 [Cichorium intybus]|uniref:Uncharacterized protein n=1 Tax=Cichorium intybus TaxID=13427 RepID=A0ACB9GFE7_CICIN|nr:hypothetical protein L2E82_11759 [Cichorium intybus]